MVAREASNEANFVPLPPSPLLRAIYAADFVQPSKRPFSRVSPAPPSPTLRDNRSKSDGPSTLFRDKVSGRNTVPLNGVLADGGTQSSRQNSFSMREDALSEKRGATADEVYNVVVGRNVSMKSVDTVDTTMTAVLADAPAAVESLQELIPERMPRDISSNSFMDIGDASMEGDMGQEYSGDTENVSLLPPLLLPAIRSDVSLRTESYSSPDSPTSGLLMRGNMPSPIQSKSRASWQKDQDVFSEEPLMTGFTGALDGTTSDRESPGGANKLPYENDGRLDVCMNETETTQSHVDESYGSDDEIGISDIAGEIVSADKLETIEVAGEAGDSDIERNAVSGRSGRTRWSVHVPRADEVGTMRKFGRGGKARNGESDDALIRQSSLDVAWLHSQRYNDRPRGEDMYRSRESWRKLTPLGQRVPVMATGGRPKCVHTGRSVSSSGTRYEDWPEYTPSDTEDGTPVGRRHCSDMSFGATDRRAALLPPELLGKPNDDDAFWDNANTSSERFSGRHIWRRRFAKTSAQRESSETRGGVMKHFSWRRKRALPPSTSIDAYEEGVGDKVEGCGEGSKRVVTSEREVEFELALTSDTVFSLLNRICVECGFRITVRRGKHKMKIEVPCGGDIEPMLVSVSLTKVAHGQHTSVTLWRSKDDVSGGPTKDIHAAGTLLRKRLESQVEFIEDSFASLYIDGSVGTELESRLGTD